MLPRRGRDKTPQVTGEPELNLEGLTGLARLSLARSPIRTRESRVTLSAWRMETASAQGSGVIVLLELSPSQTLLRGEGTHLGWTQERLSAVWQALAAPPPGEATFDLPQLG